MTQSSEPIIQKSCMRCGNPIIWVVDGKRIVDDFVYGQNVCHRRFIKTYPDLKISPQTEPKDELAEAVQKLFWHTFDAKAKYKTYYTSEDVQKAVKEVEALLSNEVLKGRLEEVDAGLWAGKEMSDQIGQYRVREDYLNQRKAELEAQLNMGSKHE